MKTPKDLISDENLERDAETLELISFAKELYKDNIKLTKQNKDFHHKANKKGFLDKITNNYSGDRIGGLFVRGLITTILIFAIYAFSQHGNTDNYYLSNCNLNPKIVINSKEEGTRVIQEVDWGRDSAATHCLLTVDEAIKALNRLQKIEK